MFKMNYSLSNQDDYDAEVIPRVVGEVVLPKVSCVYHNPRLSSEMTLPVLSLGKGPCIRFSLTWRGGGGGGGVGVGV